MTIIDQEVFLLAWDGTNWGGPYPQKLTTFENPETFEQVVLGCLQTKLSQDDSFVVVGCDLIGGGDIWLRNFTVPAPENLLPEESSWETPQQISSSEIKLENPNFIGDSKGNFHLFWIQDDFSSPSGIYYSGWNGSSWTQPSLIIKTPAAEIIRNPSVAVSSNGILYLTWSGGTSGEIYFSQAIAEKAYNSFEWAKPQALPSKMNSSNFPRIIIHQSNLNILFAVTANEARGLYLLESPDLGNTWTEPVQVFDGILGEWGYVGESDLTIENHGSLHSIWTGYQLPEKQKNQGLFYSHAKDAKNSWLEPIKISDNEILWSRIISGNNSILHILWVEILDGEAILKHQFSQDSGISWSIPEKISRYDDTLRHLDVTADNGGNLYLIQHIENIAGETQLLQWEWNGEKWLQINDSILILEKNTIVNDLSVAVSKVGKLAFVISESVMEKEIQKTIHDFLFTNRAIEIQESSEQLPSITQATSESPNPEILPTTTTQPTLLPTQTYTPTASAVPIDKVKNEGQSPWIGGLIGVGIAGVLILLAISLRFLLSLRKG